jgi:hypothetical protein
LPKSLQNNYALFISDSTSSPQRINRAEANSSNDAIDIDDDKLAWMEREEEE